MSAAFEYQVCRVNFDRVTFVNGVWQGRDVPETQRKDADLQTCPAVWDYLQSAGQQGWELVSAAHSTYAAPRAATNPLTPLEHIAFQMLYLKRAIAS